MKDAKTKEKFIELRAQGLSYQSIAAELGISKQTALNWAKELSIEIHNLKMLELDALYQKHFLSTKRRIELFGEQLMRIKDELAKRNLEQVPTERLYELLMKIMATMRENLMRLQIREEQDLVDDSDFKKLAYISLA